MIWYKIFRGAIAAVILIQLCDYTGLFTHLLEADYSTYYGSVLQETLSPNENHSWDYYSYLLNPSKQCEKDFARLTIVVKTAIQNKERRNAIRRTWGNKKRFSDVVIRIFFVVGKSSNEFLMNSILQEHQKESDVIQADFLDSYYNNTIKTILGFRWLLEFCPLSEYFLFVDDDYIVSVKNVLRFINMCKKKTHDILFSGFVMQTSPHRHKFSKWYISLREYPFDKWPPYATAGAYILSKTALAMLYSTALKIPKFKFDDIYLGMLAYQANMTLHHCNKFYFVKPHYYGPHSFRNILASHGYENPKEMESVWTDCRSAGYA